VPHRVPHRSLSRGSPRRWRRRRRGQIGPRCYRCRCAERRHRGGGCRDGALRRGDGSGASNARWKGVVAHLGNDGARRRRRAWRHVRRNVGVESAPITASPGSLDWRLGGRLLVARRAGGLPAAVAAPARRAIPRRVLCWRGRRSRRRRGGEVGAGAREGCRCCRRLGARRGRRCRRRAERRKHRAGRRGWGSVDGRADGGHGDAVGHGSGSCCCPRASRRCLRGHRGVGCDPCRVHEGKGGGRASRGREASRPTGSARRALRRRTRPRRRAARGPCGGGDVEPRGFASAARAGRLAARGEHPRRHQRRRAGRAPRGRGAGAGRASAATLRRGGADSRHRQLVKGGDLGLGHGRKRGHRVDGRVRRQRGDGRGLGAAPRSGPRRRRVGGATPLGGVAAAATAVAPSAARWGRGAAARHGRRPPRRRPKRGRARRRRG